MYVRDIRLAQAKKEYIEAVREVNKIFSQWTPYHMPTLHYTLKRQYKQILTIDKFSLGGNI